MTSIRCGKGLGDSLYLQGLARHLVAKGFRPEVLTDFPDVFRPLAGKVRVSPFRRYPVDRVAHYIPRKAFPGTDQFTDCCIQAGVGEKVEFKLDWQLVNPAWSEWFDAPAVLVALPRHPMDRADGYGRELLPERRAMQAAIDALRDRGVRTVMVGKGAPLYSLDVDLDFSNRTGVADLLDLAFLSQGLLGYCSFFAPLAESLDKPALFVWSRRGLKSANPFIRQIVPGKILAKPTSHSVPDDAKPAELEKVMDAFCQQIRHLAPV